jgi:hypothetical protein
MERMAERFRRCMIKNQTTPILSGESKGIRRGGSGTERNELHFLQRRSSVTARLGLLGGPGFSRIDSPHITCMAQGWACYRVDVEISEQKAAVHWSPAGWKCIEMLSTREIASGTKAAEQTR